MESSWYFARLSRAKKIPPLEDLFTDKKQPNQPGIDEAAIKARLKQYQASRDKLK
ncbi:MAG: hypothetical protein HQL70_09640 [Magnetococcales bacterium]|nr:hypothetical protein [Magnetococcales bacterium]